MAADIPKRPRTRAGHEFREEDVATAVRSLLWALGDDPDREGLRDTPRRVAQFYRELMVHDAGRTDTAFESIETDQMVVVSGMRVWSLCEHHLLPFWCDVTVGYITDARVLGLSKFARIAHAHAHALQVQERLVAGIAADVRQACATDNVAVVARGEHLCMTMRGVRTPALMLSSSLHGVFRHEPAVRAEFFSLAGVRS